MACEYDTPSEPYVVLPREILGGLTIGGCIAVALTALILLLTGWSPS